MGILHINMSNIHEQTREYIVLSASCKHDNASMQAWSENGFAETGKPCLEDLGAYVESRWHIRRSRSDSAGSLSQSR